MYTIAIINNYIKNRISKSWILFFAFLIFLLFYFFNIEKYTNLFATDYRSFYNPRGLLIVQNFLDFKLDNINFLDFYFLPQFITGILLKITTNEFYFSILSNIVNILSLFFSFYFFLSTFKTKNKNRITLIFLIVFFIYKANWEWCFWKLADIYFLFIFSLFFYFLYKGISQKKFIFFLYALIFSLLSLITKPQGITTIPIFLLSIILILFYKKNFFKITFVLIVLYYITFPVLIYLGIKLNMNNLAIESFINGKISFNFNYTYENFINEFLLTQNEKTKLFYFYYLLLKKFIYQITFIRDTYSTNHNIFLTFYSLIIYFFLFINLDYLIRKYEIFIKLTIITIFFAFILYCSVFTGSEPNRFQLFYLVPFYILVSISIDKFLRSFS